MASEERQTTAEHIPVTAERIARNDATFREANERIHARAVEYRIDDSFPIICECANPSCTEVIQVSFVEYEAVRQHPAQFFHSPGHDVDPRRHARVVEENDERAIVEKTGRAAQVAKEFDTRADR